MADANDPFGGWVAPGLGEAPAQDQDPTGGGGAFDEWMKEKANQDLLKQASPLDEFQPPVPTQHAQDWNLGSAVGQGLSLGAGIPAAAGVMALKEAKDWLANGASLDFVKSKLGDWYDQYSTHLTAERERYNAENPGKGFTGEVVGSIPTTMLATGLITGPVRAGLERIGLGGLSRFLGGEAAREVALALTPAGVAGAATRVGSRAAQGLTEGALAGYEQSQLNKAESPQTQAEKGGALGLASAVAMPAVRTAARAIVGSIPRGGAQLANAAENAGVPLRVNQLAREPSAQIVGAGFGSMPGQRQALTQARAQWDQDFNTVLHSAGNLTPAQSAAALDELHARRLALNYAESRINNSASGGALRHALHLSGPVGHGLAIGGGAAAGAEALQLLGHLGDPRSWPWILAAAGAAKGGRSLGNALMNSPLRRIAQRANALGLSNAEYLGIPNVAIPAANRAMEYDAGAQQ